MLLRKPRRARHGDRGRFAPGRTSWVRQHAGADALPSAGGPVHGLLQSSRHCRAAMAIRWPGRDAPRMPDAKARNPATMPGRLSGHGPAMKEQSMRPQLKPLSRQVMIITGASSGIGLAAARAAARRGAKLVLVSRDEAALQALVEELQAQQHEAIAVAADVGVEAEVRHVAARALAHFGRFDTWVNNAGVSIYGLLDQPTMEENRRLFDTNFWGVVHGALTARQHLRQHGGAIITVASMLSDMSLPLQGMYCASKHAVKGFINSLRMECEHAGEPVSLTLIKPASVNSMLTEHARNYMDNKPDLPPPVFAPRVVADAILHAAEYPVRDILAGEPALAGASFAQLAPGITDMVLRTFAIDLQQKNERDDRDDRGRNGNLFASAGDGSLRESEDRKGLTFSHSPYTDVMTHWSDPLHLLRRTLRGGDS